MKSYVENGSRRQHEIIDKLSRGLYLSTISSTSNRSLSWIHPRSSQHSNAFNSTHWALPCSLRGFRRCFFFTSSMRMDKSSSDTNGARREFGHSMRLAHISAILCTHA
uniref:Uncharacterized protein n=1 Tax=Parascaris equorum TaxID=6256 RepID=A0A914RDM5_PAREQ